MINWESQTTEILLNPRMPTKQRDELTSLLKKESTLKGHLWFTTSGTTGTLKLVALSKHALLTSAHAVNQHLNANASDIWLNVLPSFHVGGMGIWTRSHLSNSSVIVQEKWDPQTFHSCINEKQITLTSLVPTQLYDLIAHKLAAPPSLRAVIIGGGALSEALYQQAKQLSWPLLPSYGLTECCSQVATAQIDSPKLKLLSHIEASLSSDGLLQIKSPALLTTYAYPSENRLLFVDPKEEGWLITEDRAQVDSGFLHILGRSSDFVKIGGESVDMNRLINLLMKLAPQTDATLLALPDERLGHVIHLVHTPPKTESLITQFNEEVLPFERIRHSHCVPNIPRTSLGKVIKKELEALIYQKA